MPECTQGISLCILLKPIDFELDRTMTSLLAAPADTAPASLPFADLNQHMSQLKHAPWVPRLPLPVARPRH